MMGKRTWNVKSIKAHMLDNEYSQIIVFEKIFKFDETIFVVDRTIGKESIKNDLE